MPAEYAFNWAAVGIAAIFGFGGVASFFVISWILAPRSATSLTSIAYECGILPTGEGNTRLQRSVLLVRAVLPYLRGGDCFPVSVGLRFP